MEGEGKGVGILKCDHGLRAGEVETSHGSRQERGGGPGWGVGGGSSPQEIGSHSSFACARPSHVDKN